MTVIQWNEQSPIYKQLKDKVMVMLIDGSLPIGAPLPSVRQLAADYQLNPITVSRAYQELVEEGLIEKRRGVGMFVSDQAPDRAMERERTQFLTQQWPKTVEIINRLGLSVETLLKALNKEKK